MRLLRGLQSQRIAHRRDRMRDERRLGKNRGGLMVSRAVPHSSSLEGRDAGGSQARQGRGGQKNGRER